MRISKPLRVVLWKVGVHLGDELRIVGPRLVEPEDRRNPGCARTANREANPVANRRVLGLTGAPDIACADGMLHEHLAAVVDYPDHPVGGDFEGLVVGAVLFGLLRHQSDVGHAAHRRRIERSVLLAEVDHFLVDGGVAAVGDDGLGVLLIAGGIPHLPGGSDHRRHRGIDDDVARDVKVGDAFVGIDHRQSGSVLVCGLDVGFDFGALVGREAFDSSDNLPKAVVRVGAELLGGSPHASRRPRQRTHEPRARR